MTATILQFPAARAKQAWAPSQAQPFGPEAGPPGLGALCPLGLTPLQQAHMDAHLERAINDSHEQLLAAKTEEGQQHWWGVMKRLCSLRSARQIERMERAKGLR